MNILAKLVSLTTAFVLIVSACGSDSSDPVVEPAPVVTAEPTGEITPTSIPKDEVAEPTSDVARTPEPGPFEDVTEDKLPADIDWRSIAYDAYIHSGWSAEVALCAVEAGGAGLAESLEAGDVEYAQSLAEICEIELAAVPTPTTPPTVAVTPTPHLHPHPTVNPTVSPTASPIAPTDEWAEHVQSAAELDEVWDRITTPQRTRNAAVQEIAAPMSDAIDRAEKARDEGRRDDALAAAGEVESLLDGVVSGIAELHPLLVEAQEAIDSARVVLAGPLPAGSQPRDELVLYLNQLQELNDRFEAQPEGVTLAIGEWLAEFRSNLG